MSTESGLDPSSKLERRGAYSILLGNPFLLNETNRVEVITECEVCRKVAKLASFDAQRWISVKSIPIVPSGHTRILRKCPKCTSYRHMTREDWLSYLRTTRARIAELSPQITEHPGAAQEVLDRLLAIDDGAGFLQVAERLHEQHVRHSGVQTRLGKGYERFGRQAEAEVALRAVVAAGDDPTARTALGSFLARRGRPREAQSFLFQERSNDANALRVLAEAFLAQGLPREALAVITRAIAEFPADRSFPTLKLQAEWEIDASAKGRGGPGAYENRRLTRIVMASIAVLCALVVVGALLAIWTDTQARTVWVINGLSRSYQVDVGGHRVTLTGYARERIHLPEGPTNVRVVDSDLPIPPQSCNIETSWSSRLRFERPVFVINPDRTAVLISERTTYSTAPSDRKSAPPVWHVGQCRYVFPYMNFLFEAFPDSINLPHGSNTREQTRLDVLLHRSPSETHHWIESNIGPPEALDYLRNLAMYEPDREAVWDALAEADPSESTLELIRLHLDRLPVDLSLHLHYIAMTRELRPEADLKDEYLRRIDASPDSAALYFVLGRLVEEPEERERLTRKSCELTPPCLAGLRNMGSLRLGSGAFQEALEWIGKAAEIDPTGLEHITIEVLLALGRREEAMQRIATQCEQQPLSGHAALSQVLLHSMMGDKDRAREVVMGYCQRLAADGADEANQRQWYEVLEVQRRYASGEDAAYQELCARLPNRAFEAACTKSDWELAARHVDQWESGSILPIGDLLVYAGATRSGDAPIADRHLRRAIENLLSQPTAGVQSLLGRCLQGDPSLVERILNAGINPRFNRVVLLALGTRYPDLRQRCFAAARKMNYFPNFPHRSVSALARE